MKWKAKVVSATDYWWDLILPSANRKDRISKSGYELSLWFLTVVFFVIYHLAKNDDSADSPIIMVTTFISMAGLFVIGAVRLMLEEMLAKVRDEVKSLEFMTVNERQLQDIDRRLRKVFAASFVVRRLPSEKTDDE